MKANCWKDSLSRKLYFAQHCLIPFFNCSTVIDTDNKFLKKYIQDEDFLKFFIHLTLKILLPTEIFPKEQQIMDWQFANITHSTCGVKRNTLSSRHKIGEAIFIECLFKCKTRIDKCTNAGTRLCSLLSSPTSWLTDRLPTRFLPHILFRSFSVFCFWGFACFAAHIANKTYETSTQHHISDEMLHPKET